MSVEQIVEYMQNYNKNNGVFELDFIAFGRQVVADTMAAGRVGTARSYETAINALVRYLKRDTLSIHEVTVKLLTDFCNWVREQPARPNREKRDRAPSLYLGNIRILHNKAKAAYNDEDAGIIRIPLSPFKRFHVPRQPLTRKRSITIEQLQAIMRVPRRVDYPNCKKYATSRQELARDMFLLSFGLIGMNSVDMYNCTSIEGDRITYQRTKTTNRRADHATISIKIEPCVMPLVEKYRDRTGKRVFDFYQRYSTAQGFNCYINRGLKLIGKMEGIEVEDLEFYAARHTWATLARNKAEIDKATIHEALNHVDEQMRITDIYIDRDYSQQDEANKRVLELVGFTAPVD
jgi:integrase